MANECNTLIYPTSDLICGDSTHTILGKILQRLKETAGGDVNIGGVTLSASDIEIGAVELKDGTTDTRAKIRTSDPDPSDPGLVVRNIPSGTQTVSVSNFPASQTVNGTVAVSNFPATQPVSGSVSVTNFPAALAVIGGGTEATALRVTIANDSSGVLSVDDNGGSLTVDGSVSITNFPGSGTGALNQFAENAAVVSTTESTIVTYVAVTNGFISGVVVTGSAAGRYKVKVAGVTKMIVRTTAAKTTEQVFLGPGMIAFSIGDTILLTGFHEEIANQALAGNLMGQLV